MKTNTIWNLNKIGLSLVNIKASQTISFLMLFDIKSSSQAKVLQELLIQGFSAFAGAFFAFLFTHVATFFLKHDDTGGTTTSSYRSSIFATKNRKPYTLS